MFLGIILTHLTGIDLQIFRIVEIRGKEVRETEISNSIVKFRKRGERINK